MRFFAISGLSKRGKTTAAENLLKEFTRRGVTVGTIKNSSCEQINFEPQNTDTAKHRQAGAVCTLLRSPIASAFVCQRQLTLAEILPFFTQELIILEGFSRLDIPKIVAASTEADADERLSERTFAISGRLAHIVSVYRGRPVIDSFTEAERLADLAWERASADVNLLSAPY